jgi:hypothetical protein
VTNQKNVAGRIAWLTLALLALSLPFEVDRPLGQIGPLSITNVELLLLLTLAATAVTLCRSPARSEPLDRYWRWLPWFVGGLLLSVLLAPRLSGNALKASLRLISGILLALAVPHIVRRSRDVRILSIALLVAGLIAAAIGWWEVSQTELAWAGLFRSHVTRVGSYLRLTGTFDYANQAAMYIEATLPFLLAAAWSVAQATLPRWLKYPLMAVLLLLSLFYLQASIMTLSRASFATIAVVCLFVAIWLTIRQPAQSRHLALWWLGMAAVTVVLSGANVLLTDQLRLRLQGGNVDEWYQARITVPPTLTMVGGTTTVIPVAVINDGALLWQSQGESRILLGARWVDETGELRWPFPGIVQPQDIVRMDVPLTAPVAVGSYQLYWDVVHEDVIWFGATSGLFATSSVTVTASLAESSATPPAATGGDGPAWVYPGRVPDRTTLWLVGLQMMGERPLFGIGMDNYRLTYGERLGRADYDKTVHTNNFYLEMFVSAGLVGAVPFFLWLGGLLMDVLRTLSRGDSSPWQVSVAAGLLAFVIHGLVDFFLLFNATGLLFWLLVGLWISGKRQYAHRF